MAQGLNPETPAGVSRVVYRAGQGGGGGRGEAGKNRGEASDL